MIGRRLNTRLAELKMQSKETMSKQQLQKLFEHERDKELERLEQISESAKTFGRGVMSLTWSPILKRAGPKRAIRAMRLHRELLLLQGNVCSGKWQTRWKSFPQRGRFRTVQFQLVLPESRHLAPHLLGAMEDKRGQKPRLAD